MTCHNQPQEQTMESKMHVTLKLTAIKDGAVWQESVLKYPNQTFQPAFCAKQL